MELSAKHWYCTEWNDVEDARSSMTTETGVSSWRTQPAVGGHDSPGTCRTRGETTLTTFGDGRLTTPRRIATAKDQSQTSTSTMSSRYSSIGDPYATVSDSAPAGCYVVSMHDGPPGDVVSASEQCRCPQRALLVITDDDDVDVGSGTTPKNGGRTLSAGESPRPQAPRRGRTDAPHSSLNRKKPKMVVKPNCDLTTSTPTALRYYDTVSGGRLAKHLQTGNYSSLERGSNLDCGTGVPDNVTPSVASRPNTLPSRYSCSTGAVASSRRPSDIVNTSSTTYAPKLFFADSGGGGAKTHGNAAVYRVASYQNGLIGDSEHSAINRPSTATYGCGQNRRISTSRFLASSDIQVVHRGEAYRRRCACLSSPDGCICRLVVSTFTSFVAGCLVFFATRYQLRSSLPVAVGLAVSALTALLVALLLSRRCRCMVALMLPAVSTDRGRVAFVLLTVATLLSGPAVNVEFNAREMARSMTCSADIAYNQTLLLLQPFDSLLERVYITMLDLDSAVAEVKRGLQVLDKGLDTIETDIYNGRLQLYGTGKTCRVLIERAFNQCMNGIQSARDQCLGVIGALGTVYHHARHILDSINPDRWAPKHQLLLNQRRRVFGNKNTRRKDELDIAEGDDSDICEPLSTSVVCQSLNDSETLCQPSQWAGDAIQDAINATQDAMRDLQRSLQARRAASSSSSARHDSTSGMTSQTGDHVTSEGVYFRVSLAVMGQVIYVVGALILVFAAHSHLARYVGSDTYDNCYVTGHFQTLDERYCKATGAASLLPLRAHERPYVADMGAWTLAMFERRAAWRGTAVFVLQLLISLAVTGFDGLVYWVLVVVTTHAVADPDPELSLPVHGGIVDELMAAFIDSGLRPQGPWPPTRAAADPTACLPSPNPPSISALLPLVLLHVVLAVGGVLLAARCQRIRARISGYYFPERSAERAVYLYGVISSRRRRAPRLLRAVARSRARRNQRAVAVTPSMSRLPPCRGRPIVRTCCVCQGSDGQLIGCRRPSTSSRGGTESGCCTAVYCAECWEDLGRRCAICQHPSSTSTSSSQLQDLEAAVELLDADTDQLQVHCATSWRLD